MIERIGTTQTNAAYPINCNTNKASSTAVQQQDSSSKDTLNISTSSSASSGIYTKSAGVKPDIATVNMLKQQVEKNMDNLRSYVHKLLLNQGKAQSLTIDSDTVNQAKQAISEDGAWGVKAVSDRIVEFAKAICGDDKSKLETLKAAIEKGFAEVGKAFNGALPGICSQTHDEIMKKLDAWADEE